MTRLEIILIVTWVIFSFFAVDLYQRKKINTLHVAVFISWTTLVIYFAFVPWAIDIFGSYFGVARGADLIVYISIIVLAYIYVELLNKQSKTESQLTNLVSAHSFSQQWNIHMSTNSDTIFLIRVYNEQSTIYTVLERIIDYWYTDIVICDDGSTDETYIYIQEVKKNFPWARIHVLQHMINRWWWAANKTLFERIRRHGQQYTRCVTFDADGQMDISDMKTFRTYIQKNLDSRVFLWSRFIPWWSMDNIPRLRKIILHLSQIFTYIWEWRMYSDPHNGFRILHREVINNIYIHSDGMTYASELLSEITSQWLTAIEVPVNITYTDYTLAKWQKNSNAISIFLKLVRKRWFYK